MKLKQLWRFSLRDTIWITLLFGLVVAWTKDRYNLDQRLRRIEEVSNPTRQSYAPQQLTGRPDAAGPNDNPLAWCPVTQDAPNEWIDVRYKRRVLATKVAVHEVMTPGAVVRVSGFDWWGNEVTLWSGTDPRKGGTSGVSIIRLTKQLRTRRLKLYLDCASAPGWNEIDTVGLIDDGNKTQWPVGADASSTYGSRYNGYSGYGSGSVYIMQRGSAAPASQ